MKVKTTVATALAVALLAANCNAVEVKNLIQRNSKALGNAQVRGQTSANLQLSASLFAKLRGQFAAKATSEEEAYAAISQALLSVADVQACVEAELASQWGITSTLQCFAPPAEPDVSTFSTFRHYTHFNNYTPKINKQLF